MKLTQNPLFITYHLKRETSEPEVTCKGCREIMCLDYDVPSYIKGIIKFDKDFISVVDPNIYFRNQQSSLNNLTCILVVDHIFEYRECRTGIIIEDIDEIMNLSEKVFAVKDIDSMPNNFYQILRNYLICMKSENTYYENLPVKFLMKL